MRFNHRWPRVPSTPRPSAYQRDYLAYIAAHPGCRAADVLREVRPVRHRLVYDSLKRLVRAGLLRQGRPLTSNRGIGLYVVTR